MPLNCPHLKSPLDQLSLKQASFKETIIQATLSRNHTEAWRLKGETESLLHSIQETLIPAQIEYAEKLFDQEHLITPKDTGEKKCRL